MGIFETAYSKYHGTLLPSLASCPDDSTSCGSPPITYVEGCHFGHLSLLARLQSQKDCLF